MSDDDPLQPHNDSFAHDPNPDPPSAEPAFTLRTADQEWRLTPEILQRLPHITMPNCYILSTGHPMSGPFVFSGVPMLALLQAYAHDSDWSKVEVVSGDGFGTRLMRAELEAEPADRCCLLALEIDGRPMSREEGLVRLIVPSETDEALRQVKWIGRIAVI